MRQVLGTIPFLAFLLVSTAGYAHEAELSSAQKFVGFLEGLNWLLILGGGAVTLGVLIVFKEAIVAIISSMRMLLEALLYITSIALIAGEAWVPAEYLTVAVVSGCILFAGTVMLSLWIHKIEGDDPKPLALLFTVVWGAVTIYYQMTEVGVLTMLAFVTLLGFTVIVEPLSYAFGFKDDKAIAQGTTASLLVLGGALAQQFLWSDAPTFVSVFAPGAFWACTFVACTGLLIMSASWYSRRPVTTEDEIREFGSYRRQWGLYLWLQALSIIVFLGVTLSGFVLNATMLSGIAGTFLALYLAVKPWDFRPKGMVWFGFACIASGAILMGVYWLAMEHQEAIKQVLSA